MGWLDAAYGTTGIAGPTQAAASNGAYYDPAKLQALLTQIKPGADGRKVLGNDAWMQLLNPISGLKLSQPADPGHLVSGGDSQDPTMSAPTPAIYKDAQGRTYKDTGGGKLQYFDNSGGGWQNPTGNSGDRIQPTYQLGADGTATPISSGAAYQPSTWVSSGRDAAKILGTVLAAGAGGAALAGSEAGAAGGAASYGGVGTAGAGAGTDAATTLGAGGGLTGGGTGTVIAGNTAGNALGYGAANSAAAQAGLSAGQYAGAGELAADGGALAGSAPAYGGVGTAGAGAATDAATTLGAGGMGTGSLASPGFFSSLAAGNYGDAASAAGNAAGKYFSSPSGIQSVVGLAGSYLSSQQQANAAKDASANAMAMYNQTRQDNAPWRAQGGNAVNQLGDLLGTSGNTGASGYGSLTHQFGAADLNSNLAPNYQFQLQQGLGASANAANASGFSGNALKGINDYAQNYAGNAYQQAFNNYTANQTNTYNRLSNLAGLGQTANQTTANSGTANVANANNYLTGGAAAGAAGIVGGANAINNGINNYQGWNYLNDPARVGAQP